MSRDSSERVVAGDESGSQRTGAGERPDSSERMGAGERPDSSDRTGAPEPPDSSERMGAGDVGIARMAGPDVPPERLLLYAELGNEVRANQRATDMVDELVCQLLGVNRTDARCLDILDERGSMSAGDLAEATRLTTGAITSVIDRLQRAGYAQRVPDPSDRRRVVVELTPKATKAAIELMGEPLAELSQPLTERYGDHELRLFVDFMRAGREIQERHAEWLRERLRERDSAHGG